MAYGQWGGDGEEGALLSPHPISIPARRHRSGDTVFVVRIIVEPEVEDEEAVGLLSGPTEPKEKTTGNNRDGAGRERFGQAFNYVQLHKGTFAMFSATAIYSLQSVIAKTVERQVPSMEVVLVRSTLSGLITVGAIILQEHVFKNAGGSEEVPGEAPPMYTKYIGEKQLWHLLTLRGILGSLAFSFAYTSLPYLEVGDQTAIFFLYPVIISILAWPVLREAVDRWDVCAIFAGLLGMLLIVRPPFLFDFVGIHESTAQVVEQKSPRWVGVMLVFAGACCCAGAMLTIRVIGKRASAYVLAVWFHGTSAVTGLLAYLIGLQTFVWPDFWDSLGLLLVAATSFVGIFMLQTGYQLLPATVAAGYSYLQVAWGFALGVLILNEQFTLV
ncbi:hypothetical protein CYMTET_21248, partial [Cymbomonas tetramitiformis]